jgi:UDP-glucose 4-epimerase
MANSKKILVIGGSGFLGSHVADALSDEGHQVTLFDHRTSPHLREDQTQVVGDILDQNSVHEAVKGHAVVFHFAGIADIDECDKKPLDTVRFNILGTTYVLEACREFGVEKLVFASSAYVYSNAGSFYRVSKQACENLIEAYRDKYDLNYVILRYGSLYGPRSDSRNSLYRICQQALTEHKITYGGTGDEKREFIHVFDASRMSVEILDEEYNNQSIILTGADSIKYQDLLLMISEMLHDRVKIEKVEKKSNTHYKQSPYAFSPKFGKKLTTNPHVDLGQGLLNLLGEIHSDLHPELQEKFGLLIQK